MLIMRRKPIKTCLDFFEYFSYRDAISDPDALISFATGNLMFNDINAACIKLLERALKDEEKIVCGSASDFWQGTDTGGRIPSEINSFLNECYVIFDGSSPDWGRKYITYCALSILAKNFVIDLGIKDFDRRSVSEDNVIDLTKDVIEVIPGRTYSLRGLSDVPPKFMIHTSELKAKPGYTVSATVKAGGKTYSIPSGGSMYINSVNGGFVKVLPDETVSGGRKISRGSDAGRGITVPKSASSFACFGDGRVAYIKDGRLRTLGDAKNIPRWLFDEPSAEVMAVDREFYILSADGIVTNSAGLTPDGLKSRFTDLEKALKGRSK